MSSTPHASTTSFVASLRALGDGLIGGLEERVELLSVEVHAEKIRVLQMLTWMCATLFLGAFAVAFASVLVIVVFWDTARVAAVAAVAAAYVGGAIGAVIGWRRFAKQQPRPFAGTLEELREDRTWLQGHN